MTDDKYVEAWKKDIKDYIRKTSQVIASATHFYVLRRGGFERRKIVINMYAPVRLNMLAWPTQLPIGFCDDQFVHYVEYLSLDSELLSDGYIIHGLDQFMGLHAASSIYSFLEKLEKDCILYYDDSEASRRLFNEEYAMNRSHSASGSER